MRDWDDIHDAWSRPRGWTGCAVGPAIPPDED